jgi:hypothetical protein
MDEHIHKIGQPIGEPPPDVYELILDDHVPFADPASYGLSEKSIKPSDYFITSGDAVEKTKVMEKDLWVLAGELRKRCCTLISEEKKCTNVKAQEWYRKGFRPSSNSAFAKYEDAVWKSAGASRRLLNALKKAKGTNVFLETEWDCHRLLCIPKNPRKQVP